MIQRCTNPKKDAFKYYGARGIKVCEQWRNYDRFLADVGEAPSPAHTLDRIDPFGHYEPGNVRWATMDVQSANKTNSLPEAEREKRRRARLRRKAGISLRPRYKFDTTGITYCVDPDWDS
jgi:hypothetical protein